jgi:cytochrome P450
MCAMKPYDSIPEPRRFGRAGHLPEWLGKENAEQVLARLLRYAEECGPLARVTLGPVRMLVVSDSELAAEALSDARANYKGAAYILTRVVLDNVLLLNGDVWQTHRKTYQSAVKNVDAVGAARTVTERFVRDLRRRDSDAPLMLDREVLRLIGDVVGRFVAGVTLTDDFEPHRHRVQYELAAVGIDLQCQPWTYLSPMRWMRLRRSVAETRRFFSDAVRERLARPDDSIKDVLNGFIQLARAGAYPSDVASIQEGVVNFFFTAHDVLASSTAWTLHLLAKHPEIQARLRASLAEDEGRRVVTGNAELERVVKEGLRLFPGYALFGRTTQARMEIGGHDVPKGTMLITSPFVTHRLARYWPDPARFDPDRWRTRPRGTPPAAARDHYLPFGSGARSCLASHLAFPLVETIVAEVVRAVELQAVPGHDPGLVYWGTSYARNGMPVRVKNVEPERASLHA